MTAFMLIAAVMLLAALVLVVRPLLRPRVSGEGRLAAEPVAAAIVIVLVPALAAAFYAARSNWQWNRPIDPQEAALLEIQHRVGDLSSQLQKNENDVDGWLQLGRSQVELRQFDRAVDAYKRAYDLTQGENIDAIMGLGEALTLVDQNALAGKAGQLFELAALKEPTNPKVLWYSSMAALQAGKLAVARDRMQLLLAQNPPDQIRMILEREIGDLNEQMAAGSSRSGEGNAAGNRVTAGSSDKIQRSIKVSVTLAPQLRGSIAGADTLFILARDPAGGPPLAAVRRASSELPLTVELSEQDAMVPGRTIAGRSMVQIVARLSRSGQPIAQSGDFFGQADYTFDKSSGAISIAIDSRVP
jgi:cytochrome c-type biogenesis protein CcmH